jgi:methyl-accepting chemotaxis protein
MLDSSARVVQQAEQRAGEIGRHSDDATFFLQFGDIVRQKLEHVVDALVTGAGSGPGGAAAFNASKVAALDRLIAIQTGQLQAIRKEALTARDQLAAAFDGLARETASLVGDIAALAQDDDTPSEAGNPSNRLQSLSADILHLRTLHTRSRELGLQSQGTAQRAADASAKLGHHLYEVTALNLELHLQALNAIVKTARLGSVGAPLGVLSAHVHEVSQDSGRSVAEILPLLDRIRECTTSLGDDGQQSGVGTTNGDSALERGLQDIVRLHAQFHETSTTAATLATRQTQSLAEVSTHLDFLAGFDTLLTELIADLGAARVGLAPHLSSISATPAQEAELLVAYTMESEREIHRRILGEPLVVSVTTSATAARDAITTQLATGASDDPTPSPAIESAASPSAAGDNVEFF